MTSLLLASGTPEALAARPPHGGPKPPNAINLTPVIDSVQAVGGSLVASGTVNAVINGRSTTVPFTAPVTLSVPAGQAGVTCPVLDLTLGPIDLDLLGLVVTTSPICLTITANQGGGLLGDLLCSVANLLNGGLSLSDILNGAGLLDPLTGNTLALSPADVTALLGGLTDLLNGALSNLLDAIVAVIGPSAGGATCRILHLELGPLDLTLLGLEVVLDNCSGGPVVVDLTGQRGRGNLLGNLLCGLLGDGLINIGATLQQILNQVLAAL